MGINEFAMISWMSEQNKKLFSYSNEFKKFWGESIDPRWFQKSLAPSWFVIVTILLVLLILYFSAQLLFDEGEIQEIIYTFTHK